MPTARFVLQQIWICLGGGAHVCVVKMYHGLWTQTMLRTLPLLLRWWAVKIWISISDPNPMHGWALVPDFGLRQPPGDICSKTSSIFVFRNEAGFHIALIFQKESFSEEMNSKITFETLLLFINASGFSGVWTTYHSRASYLGVHFLLHTSSWHQAKWLHSVRTLRFQIGKNGSNLLSCLEVSSTDTTNLSWY